MMITTDVILLLLMSFGSLAFMAMVVYKFRSYRRPPNEYHGNYRDLFKDVFNDKHRLN
jgi:hypothetical protein